MLQICKPLAFGNVRLGQFWSALLIEMKSIHSLAEDFKSDGHGLLQVKGDGPAFLRYIEDQVDYAQL